MKQQSSTDRASGDVGNRADAVNIAFHEAYDGARAKASHEIPVLVVLGNDLILVRGETRSVTPCIPTLFHWTKAVAHAPVTVVAICHRSSTASLDEGARTKLMALQGAMSRLLPSLEGAGVRASDRPTIENLARVIVATTAEIESILSNEGTEPEALRTFAAAMGPLLLQLTEEATTLQLRALHEVIPAMLGALEPADRASLEVVVAGAHQARARNLPMQYFRKLFGESPGDERRVSYAENAQSVEDALAQVATRRLDREIARAFFGDERRLQRDVLGDAAEKQLAVLELKSER